MDEHSSDPGNTCKQESNKGGSRNRLAYLSNGPRGTGPMRWVSVRSGGYFSVEYLIFKI